jgi:hypothetical protein
LALVKTECVDTYVGGVFAVVEVVVGFFDFEFLEVDDGNAWEGSAGCVEVFGVRAFADTFDFAVEDFLMDQGFIGPALFVLDGKNLDSTIEACCEEVGVVSVNKYVVDCTVVDHVQVELGGGDPFTDLAEIKGLD